MPGFYRAGKIEIVIKISKYCNLRCSYCYEFPFLGDRTVMPISNIEKLFSNIAIFETSAVSKLADGEDRFSFIWHGGEPFMQPLDYYEQIGTIQEDTIPKSITYHNSVQTNLTVLTERHIDHLKERRFFQSVGFSFDVYGDQRPDISGRSSTEKVLRNLQKLNDHGIETGAICVLSRSTFPHIKNIFKFYESIGTSFRILPYHIEKLEDQTKVNGLLPGEIASAMCTVFDMWLATKSSIDVSPLDTYLGNAIYYLNSSKTLFYDKLTDESIFIVETNGETYGYNSYGGDCSYGNLFDQSFEEILVSKNRRDLASRANQRVETYCLDCKYYGACSGYPVADANPFEEKWLSTSGCYVASIINHIVNRLLETGLSGLGMGSRPFKVRPSEARGNT